MNRLIQKLIASFFKRVILPVLRIFFEEVLKQLANWLLGKMHDILRKWRKEECDAASTDDERVAINRKYDKRESELAEFEKEVPTKLKEVINDAVIEAGKHSGETIEVANEPEIKQLKSVEEKPPKPPKKRNP